LRSSLLLPALLLTSMITICSCALFRQPLDKISGFSSYLRETERYIRTDEWSKAEVSLKQAAKTWKRLKPYLQIDIDHDYVKEIESNFVLLRGNIETKAKPNSLALILLLQDNWKNIDSM
jgi:uncharacterized protein YxeA